MYIRCKSCGQLLFIPDDVDYQTVNCPACQSEFLYTPEEKASNRDFFESENTSKPFDPQSQYTSDQYAPQFDDLPETATRESYHQSRNLSLQPFSSWDAVLSAYGFFSERFGVMILVAILLTVPNLIMNLMQSAILPEITDLYRSLAEKETFEEVFNEYMTFFQNVPQEKAFILSGCNILFSLAYIFLLIGGIRLFNAFGRKQKASLSLLFSGFDSPLRVLIACCLLFVLFLAFCVAACFVFVAMAMAGLSFFAVLLFFMLLIFFLVYLFFIFPLIADSNVSAVKAFHLSYLIAKRNLSTLFGTISLLFLISMLIGFFTMAVFGGILSSGYVSLISQALYMPILLGVISSAYLKATGQFRR